MDSGSNGQSYHDQPVFPYVCDLAPDSSHASLADSLRQLRGERQTYTEQARRHGAVLFRNTGGRTAKDFDAMVRCFGLPNFPYEKSLSNAVRVEKTERVFTANEAPSDVRIYLHHEMRRHRSSPVSCSSFVSKRLKVEVANRFAVQIVWLPG